MAKGRGFAGVLLTTIVMLAVLIGLGVWQLQRKDEKRALIAALDARLAAAPTALPPATQWPSLNAAKDEFRRVTFSANIDPSKDVMVFGSGSGIRADVSGPGTWAFVPAKLAGGETVAINLGFVQNTLQDRAQQDRAVAALPRGAQTFTGYMRFPEHAGWFSPKADAMKRLWFERDHEAMAQALGWGQPAGQIAPFYIDLESPVPPSGIPKPGPLSVRLKDNHLQYAITWFGLAAAVLIAFGFWLAGHRKAARSSASL
ncbi:MAG: SURF1 family protein [Pseudomonadota bacterium]